MFKKVKVNGECEFVDSLTLEQQQEFVGGYIEEVGRFIVNEEGLRLNLPRNQMYSQFVGNVIVRERKSKR